MSYNQQGNHDPFCYEMSYSKVSLSKNDNNVFSIFAAKGCCFILNSKIHKQKIAQFNNQTIKIFNSRFEVNARPIQQ